jgi:hypothetical protein
MRIGRSRCASRARDVSASLVRVQVAASRCRRRTSTGSQGVAHRYGSSASVTSPQRSKMWTVTAPPRRGRETRSMTRPTVTGPPGGDATPVMAVVGWSGTYPADRVDASASKRRASCSWVWLRAVRGCVRIDRRSALTGSSVRGQGWQACSRDPRSVGVVPGDHGEGGPWSAAAGYMRHGAGSSVVAQTFTVGAPRRGRGVETLRDLPLCHLTPRSLARGGTPCGSGLASVSQDLRSSSTSRSFPYLSRTPARQAARLPGGACRTACS